MDAQAFGGRMVTGFAARFAVVAVAAAFQPSAYANADIERGLSLDAVVVNQTQSAAGQEFFRLFSAAWSESGLNEGFGVRVAERASARFGSQISVYHQNTLLVQTFLPFNHDRIRALALQINNVVVQKAVEVQANALFFGGDPDLAPDELH